jgi:hypothetical protein
LLSLAGPVGGPYQVILARAGDAGIEVVGGTLRRGRAESVSAVLFPMGSVREVAPAAASEPARSEPVPSSGSSWAARANAAAVAAGHDPSEEVQYRPGRGELVQHFAFGLCDVLKANGDTLTIREIRIDQLQVQAPVEEGGKRVYRLMRKP